MEEKNNKKIKEYDKYGLNANNLCFACMQYFCDSCFKLIHDKIKNSQHKKELIDPYVPIDVRCPKHPMIPINLFCLDDKGKYFILISYDIFLNKRTLLCILFF